MLNKMVNNKSKMIKPSYCQEVYPGSILCSSNTCTERLNIEEGGEPSEDLHEQTQGTGELLEYCNTKVVAPERQENETYMRSAQVFVKSVSLKKLEKYELNDIGIQVCFERDFDEESSTSQRNDNKGEDKLEGDSQFEQKKAYVPANGKSKQTNLSNTDGSEDENPVNNHKGIDLAKQDVGPLEFVKKVKEDAENRDKTVVHPQAKKEKKPKKKRTRSKGKVSSNGQGIILNKKHPPLETYMPDVNLIDVAKEFGSKRINIPWLQCLLLLCCFSVSSGTTTGIQWTVASKPAVIGENLTLACAVGSPIYPVSWHRGKSEELLDLVSMETYPSDRRKFEITVGKVENMTWYNLTIMDLNTSDLGLYYRCSNGDNMWDVRMLNFSEYNLLSIPGENDVGNRTRIDNEVKKVSLIIDRVYPKPACHLSSEQAQPQTLKDNVLREEYGRYQLEYRFDIPPCSRQTLSCDLANQTILNKTFLGFDAPECFPLDPDYEYHLTIPGDGVPFLMILVAITIFIIVLCICYLGIWRGNINIGSTERVGQKRNGAVLLEFKDDEQTSRGEMAESHYEMKELGSTIPEDEELSKKHCMEWIRGKQPLKCCFDIKLGRTTVVSDPADF